MEDRIRFSGELCRVLDELGDRRPKGEKQSALIKSWKNEVFLKLYEAVVSNWHPVGGNDDGEGDARSEAVMTFIDCISAFDPDKGKLSCYARKAVNRNYTIASKTEIFIQNTGGLSAGKLRKIAAERKKLENSLLDADPVQRQKKLDEFDALHYPNVEQLRLGNDDEDDSLLSNDPGHADDIIGYLIVQNQMLEIATQIILLQKNREHARKNDSKWRMFPLWFTEKITNTVQSNLLPDDENNVFYAMELCYLDFFMEHQCRSFLSMRACGLRRENEIFPESGSSARLRWTRDHWLEARVPIRYLLPDATFSDSTISRSRKSYEEELMSILGLKR